MKYCQSLLVPCVFLVSCGAGDIGFEQRIAEIEAERDALYFQVEEEKGRVKKIRKELTNLKESTAQSLQHSNEELEVEIRAMVSKIQKESNPDKIFADRKAACLVEFRSETENQNTKYVSVPFSQGEMDDWKCDWNKDDILIALNKASGKPSAPNIAESDPKQPGRPAEAAPPNVKPPEPEPGKEDPKRVIFRDGDSEYYIGSDGIKMKVFYEHGRPYVISENGLQRTLPGIKKVGE